MTINNPGGQYVNLFDAAAAQAEPTAAAGAGAADPTLEFLRNSPQFLQLRQLVQSQPHLLQPLLQQLGQSNPQLLQLISNNQDQFLGMLGADGTTSGGADMAAMLDGLGGAEGEEAAPPTQQYITITPEEDEAVGRVTNL